MSLNVVHPVDMTHQESRADDSRMGGILLILCSAFIFAISDAGAKLLVGTLPPLQTFWMRSVVVLVLTIFFVMFRKGPQAFRTARPGWQIVRSLFVVISSLMFLTGLTYLPLADASAINFVWPMLITVFSALFLGEKVGIRRILATVVGFCGMLIMVRPGTGAFQTAAFFPILAATLWALASVMTRSISRDDSAETTMFWYALVAVVASSLFVPLIWQMPTMREIVLAMFIGLGSTVGHGMVIFAYSRTYASTLAPYSYTQLIWAAFAGFFIFNTFPDRWIILGAAVIAASGIYTAHRERVRGAG
jgi:drug/metabolite transporter (DMT)-like permease